MIQAKLQVYFWLGSIKHKKSYPSGLPPGFQVTNELLNAERPGLPPPTAIHYAEKHVTKISIVVNTLALTIQAIIHAKNMILMLFSFF